MTASTASDNSPAISQVFRKRGLAGVAAGGFGTRTTGAAGSIRAVSIATGLFMLRTPPTSPRSGNVSGPSGFRLDPGQIRGNSKEMGQNGPVGAANGRRPTAPARYPNKDSRASFRAG